MAWWCPSGFGGGMAQPPLAERFFVARELGLVDVEDARIAPAAAAVVALRARRRFGARIQVDGWVHERHATTVGIREIACARLSCPAATRRSPARFGPRASA